MEFLIWVVGSYLLGSTPTSILVSRIFFSCDIRKKGSGNAGATNVFRCLGWKPAVFVAAFDIFKGWFPAAMAGIANFHGDFLDQNRATMMILCGFAAVLGHTYTIFAGFKGGKGVGTGAGMLIALFPLAIGFCVVTFAIVLMFTGMVSLSSICASIALPVTLAIFRWGFQMEVPPIMLIFSLLIPIFIAFTHRSNIVRIFDGTEHRFERAMILGRRK